MSYEKQNFVNDQTLTADHLNHIEDGIEQLNQELDDAITIEFNAGKRIEKDFVGNINSNLNKQCTMAYGKINLVIDNDYIIDISIDVTDNEGNVTTLNDNRTVTAEAYNTEGSVLLNILDGKIMIVDKALVNLTSGQYYENYFSILFNELIQTYGNNIVVKKLDIVEADYKQINSELFSSGDFHLLSNAEKQTIGNVLTKDNTKKYTPTENYNPATKLYVDDAVLDARPLYDVSNIVESKDYADVLPITLGEGINYINIPNHINIIQGVEYTLDYLKGSKPNSYGGVMFRNSTVAIYDENKDCLVLDFGDDIKIFVDVYYNEEDGTFNKNENNHVYSDSSVNEYKYLNELKLTASDATPICDEFLKVFKFVTEEEKAKWNNKSDKLVYSDEASYTFNINELEIIEKEGAFCSYNAKGLIRIIPNKSVDVSITKKDGSIESLPMKMATKETSPDGILSNIVIASSENYSKFFQLITNVCPVNNSMEDDIMYDPLNNMIFINHPDIDNIESITVTTSGEFNIDDEKVFDDRYQLVNEFEKDYWNNKVDIEDIYHDTRVMEEEPIVISFDGNLEGKEYIQMSDALKLIKISDYCEKHEIMGIDVEMTGIDGTEIQSVKYGEANGLNPQELAEALMLVSNENYSLVFSGMWIIVYNDNTFIAEIDKTLNKGVWVIYQNQHEIITYISSIFLYKKESGNFKKIDNKFIDYKYSIPFGTHLTYTDENDNKVNVVADYCAEAFNRNTVAAGMYSHAEGCHTTALGEDAHAEGYRTIARGNESHAEGFYTVSGSFYQHVQGKYNIVDNNNVYAHIVGNGHISNRSNAHTLDWNGNAWFAGKVTANGNPVNAKDLTTKEYVDTLAANAAIMNIAHIEEIDALIEDNNINVLDYKYQRVEMFNNANIVLPEVNTFTEIHLFFDPTEDLTINLPDCRKKQLPEILANKSYELVAIYNMNYWLVEINVFE